MNVFVMAGSPEQSRTLAIAALREDHFIVLDEESIPFKLAELDWDEQPPELVAELEKVRTDITSETPVQYGGFQTYTKSGLDA